MKKLYTFVLIAAVLLSINASAVVVTITQSSLTFSPVAPSVNVGDVIHFVWTGGSHTTTSVSVPAGAATWDAPLNSANPTFDYTVTVAGNYGYWCTFHSPNMAGGFVASVANSIEPVLNTVSDFSVGIDNSRNTIYVNIDNNSPAKATLRMLDITGREVLVLLETQLGMGEQSFHYDLSDQVHGMYFLRLEQNGRVVTKKILLN